MEYFAFNYLVNLLKSGFFFVCRTCVVYALAYSNETRSPVDMLVNAYQPIIVVIVVTNRCIQAYYLRVTDYAYAHQLTQKKFAKDFFLLFRFGELKTVCVS